MTSVNAGRVELDIVAIAKDQVSATLREVNKSLAGTKQQMDAVKGSAGGGLGGLFASAKEGIKPVNSIREGFENIKANVLGLPTMVGAAVTGVVALASALEEADVAGEALKKNAQEYAEAIRGVVDWVKQLRSENGKETKEQQDAAADRIKKQEALRTATENLLFLESEIKTVRDRQAATAESWAGWLADSKSAYLEIHTLENQRLEAEREIARLTAESAENIQRQATAALVLGGLRGFASGAGKGVEKIDGTIAVVGRRGSARGSASGADDTLVDEFKARMSDLSGTGPDVNEASAMRRLMRRLGVWGRTAGQEADVTTVVEQQTDAVKALADEYNYLGSSILGLSGPLGMLNGSLGEMTKALGTGLSAAAQFTSGDIIGGIGSVLGGILDLFGGTEKKTRDLVRQSELDRNRSPSTVVINVAPGTDPQSVARELRRVDYSSRGTGRPNVGV